ncbi:MAG: OmpA family protein [Alphaproteobacteria bacterium]|nr:OmpA family protein [Alphaproteobacteria bacterium]
MPNARLFTGMVAGAALLGGCATKDYVNEHVAHVQTQVDAQQQQLNALDSRAGEIDQRARDALDRANAAQQLAEGKFTYTTVHSEDVGPFRFDSAKLPDDARARLSDMARSLIQQNKNYYIEIQGHTDKTGPERYNYRLGDERADAVRRFLNEQGVALNRMASISYGEDQQIDGGNRQNRRVTVLVVQ